MNAIYLAALVILLTGAMYWIPHYFTGGFKKYRFSRFIPALLALMAVALFYVRAAYFRTGFSSIVDMIFIVMLSISTVILLLAAFTVPEDKA
ncbi:MAG: hypothetical protein WD535_05185 [Thermaerobacterales bacterium]